MAHLDHDPCNNNLDNLAWLCLTHHDQYDSIHRQAKGITIEEAKSYRAKLYAFIEDARPGRIKSDCVLEMLDRYSMPDEAVIKEITGEILGRIDLIQQFTRLDKEVYESLSEKGIVNNQGDAYYFELEKLVKEKMNFPHAIWVLQTADHLWPSWNEEVGGLAKRWIRGVLTDDEHADLFQLFEEAYELDLYYIFFGLPAHNLSPPQIRALSRFTSGRGQQDRIRQLYPEPEDVPF
jgi:hypothetical protein